MSERSDPGGLGALSPFRRRWEWDVSAVVNREVQIDALLMMGGPQVANILENYEKNAKRIKRFQMFQGLAVAVLVGFLTVIPIMALQFAMNTEITEENSYTTFYATSTAITGYYLMLLGTYLSFVMILAASFLKGDAFRFLSYLPISKQRMTWIVAFAFIRPHILPLLATLLALPVAGTLVTGSGKFLVASLICNAFLCVFTIGLLVIIAEIMVNRVFKESRSTVASVTRTVFTVMYLTLTMAIFLFITPFLDWVSSLFAEDPSSISSQGMLVVMALIPFPFAPASFMTLSLFPSGMVATRIASVFGVVLFMALTFWLSLRAGGVFLRIASWKENVGLAERPAHAVPDRLVLEPVSPVTAFVRSSLAMVSRDVSRMSMLVVPMILPLMMGMMYVSIDESMVILGLGVSIGYMGLMPDMMNQAFAGTEMKMGGVLKSLPYRNWDLFRARRRLISVFMTIPMVILFVTISAGYGVPGEFVWYYLSVFPFMVFITTLYLVMYAFLFGKVNENYTLFEVNIGWRMGKRLILLGVPFMLIMIFYIGVAMYIGLIADSWVGPVATLWVFNIVMVFFSDAVARRLFKGPSLLHDLRVAGATPGPA